jgi:hypothetical protein
VRRSLTRRRLSRYSRTKHVEWYSEAVPALMAGRFAPSESLTFAVRFSGYRFMLPCDLIRGHCQAGSLTGAVHLSKNNAGVLRPAQRGQKPRVEQKGKSWLDPDVQYA